MSPPPAADRVPAVTRLIRELRRRRVLRTAALYVVGAWLALQVADVLFPGFGIPETAIQVLVWTAVVGFPIALVFGWFFDIGPGGVRRTLPATASEARAAQPLGRSDYVLLAAFAGVAGVLVYNATERVREVPVERATVLPLDVAVTAPDDAPPKLENSVAVLPFANLSSDAENDFFCDGVSEEILHELAEFRELNVIGRTSSFAFKGSDYGIPRISGLLGVRYVLQGSVRKQEQQLRIAAQLLDEHGIQVWSERFDRELRNVFEIQSEIAATVAGNIATHLTARSRSGHLPSVEAYEVFLRGRELLHQREPWNALPLLQRAIELDERFAEAHAELAVAHLTSDDPARALPRAREAIDRAVAFEPRSLRAQTAEGLWMLMHRPPRAADAERVLRTVIAQDPSSSDALLWLSNALNHLGRHAESRDILERAARIDPLHPSVSANLAGRLIDDGDMDGALRLMRRQLELPGIGGTAYFRYAALVRQTGRLVEYHDNARNMALRGHVLGYPMLGHSYRAIGRPDTAASWFERGSRMLEAPVARFLATVRASGQEAESLREFERVMRHAGLDLASLSGGGRIWYGALLARTGAYVDAIEVLEPVVDPARGRVFEGGLPELDGVHALAWAYLQTGAHHEAERTLAHGARQCGDTTGMRRYRDSDELHYCAENALLRGDRELALATLESAADLGWRGYYLREFDPYWQPLAPEPRYRTLMARVKADVDRQRAEIEQRDAKEDFVARIEAAEAERAGRAGDGSGVQSGPP